jgi:radical SAM superfamily enzyme YgiQ (UPF0313 family)
MKHKVLLLNLPNPEQITRRYMCSYTSPESLMPPLELISCAAVAREWHQAEVKLLDAIAEQLSVVDTLIEIKRLQPEVILALTGFECYEDDMNTVCELKKHLPESHIALFGHYATHFPKETLIHSKADFVILGEPELVLNDLLKTLFNHLPIEPVTGIAYLRNDIMIKQGEAGRIRDPNDLPVPAYDLLPMHKYGEPLMAHPYGMIQTVRGCPYQCNYCVKSYGTKLSQLSTERVIKEMKQWIDLQGVKSIRFIDDTFTLNKHRVIELCQAIIKNDIRVEWACLSRTDNLDTELLDWMKKSGCKRIYFGMESGSQRMLDIYNKNVKIEDALHALHLCRKAGIETAAFFMSGHPLETEKDFEETLAFAKAAHLNYASFNPLTPYPGTGLFDEIKGQLNFSIYPYKNEWKEDAVYENFDRRKQLFYKGFYMRFNYFNNNISTMINNFGQIANMGFSLLRYLWWDKRFVISGLKGARDK